MKLLKEFMTTPLTEASDESALPEDVMKDLRSNIGKGAKDTTQKWANALELVHKAYEVSNVERPNPDLKAAWKQYEELIQYAVKQLSNSRGMDADWRMSAAVFHEAEAKFHKFKMTLDLPGDNQRQTIIKAESIEKALKPFLKVLKDYGSKHKLEIVDELPMGRKYRAVHQGPVSATTNVYLTIERV